ncbi:MAG TPA: ATP-dependent DNA helicase, partial [Caulobacter sp.]|nr:ATP-dependent DNA helicase [Caulobacter sp.]
MNAPTPVLELAPALVVLPGARSAVADGAGAKDLRPPYAREMLEHGPVLLAHAGMTARRLGMNAPGRSRSIFDALELFAFVRPAKFTAPSAVGLAQALGL